MLCLKYLALNHGPASDISWMNRGPISTDPIFCIDCLNVQSLHMPARNDIMSGEPRRRFSTGIEICNFVVRLTLQAEASAGGSTIYGWKV